MVNIVVEDKNIDYSKVKIKKPYIVDNNNIFNIYYDDGPFLIQTPVSFLPDTYNIIDGRSLEMDIIFNDKKFVLLLDKINNYIYDTINKHFDSENIKMYKIYNNDDYILNIKNYNYDAIKVFNNDKLIISIQNLSKYDRIKSIFQIEKYIFSKKKSWFYFKIFQILKLDHGDDITQINSNFLFVQENIDFEKYHKMKQFGVPHFTIEQQMKLDGFNDLEISNFSSRNNSKKNTPPLPPPPPPKKLIPSPPPPPPLNIKLHKNIQNPKQNIQNTHQDQEQKLNKNGPPSLFEILNAKSRLKKIISK